MRLLWCLCVVFFSCSAQADYQASKQWFYAQEAESRLLSQFLLIFSGDYNAIVDGDFGKRTYQALTSFQRRNFFAPDGVLSSTEVEVLVGEALTEMDRQGFEFVFDEATQQELGIPTALVPVRQSTNNGTRWSDHRGLLEIQTMSISNDQASFTELYTRLSSEQTNRQITYKVMKGQYFVVSGYLDGRGFYLRMERSSGSTKGFSLSWIPDGSDRHKQIAVAMSNSLRVNPNVFRGEARRGQTKRVDPATPKRTQPAASAGSGFFVSRMGHIATNAHVVEGCSVVHVAGRSSAKVLKIDQHMDLALLQIESKTTSDHARFRLAPIKRGEAIYAMGYPLTDFLADNLTITQGIVASLAGLGGDITKFQISAGVQPGNSGGPVIDKSGNVVGAVVSRLDDQAAIARTGAVPQNVNFAIRDSIITAFMMNAGVQPDYSHRSKELKPEQIADIADDYTVQVVCDPNKLTELRSERSAEPHKKQSALQSDENSPTEVPAPLSDEEFIQQLEAAIRNAAKRRVTPSEVSE